MELNDKYLFTPCTKVHRISAKMKLEFRGMIKLCKELDGAVGLAANQVGLRYNAFAVVLPREAYGYLVLPYVAVNAEVLAHSPESAFGFQGCLSHPEAGTDNLIEYPKWIVITYIDGLTGRRSFKHADGLEAAIIWHELKHVRGLCSLSSHDVSVIAGFSDSPCSSPSEPGDKQEGINHDETN